MHQFPNQLPHVQCGILETYTEVDLARLEPVNIDRESFHGWKTKTVAELEERERDSEQILRVLKSPDHFLKIPKSSYTHTRPLVPPPFLSFQNGDRADGLSLPGTSTGV